MAATDPSLLTVMGRVCRLRPVLTTACDPSHASDRSGPGWIHGDENCGGDRGEQRHRGCDGPAAGGGGLPRLLRRAPRGPGARAGRGDRGYGGPLRRDLPGEVAALAEAVGDRLDVLVNNAGGAIGADPVAAARAEDWRAMYEVNVIGLLQSPRRCTALVASGAGTIVNVGSTAGRIAYEGGGGYTAAKHGTQVVSETLRLELFDQPVRVCEIAPGMVRTDEFSVKRFGGDQEKADRIYEGVAEPLVAERRSRRDRLGGHPAAARERGRDGDPAAGAGRPAQGAPGPRVTPAAHRSSSSTRRASCCSSGVRSSSLSTASSSPTRNA